MYIACAFTCTFSSPCSAFIRFLFFFSLCLFDLQLLFLNTCQKVINGVGWPDDRRGLSPILYDMAPVFVHTDQLLYHCFHLLLFSLMVGLLHAMAFMVLLLVGWVIKPLPLLKACWLRPVFAESYRLLVVNQAKALVAVRVWNAPG